MENKFVVFTMASEMYGLNINCVSEIIKMQSITKLPKTSGFVEGIINLRGKVIAVIDLRKRFGLECTKCDNKTRIIVVTLGQVTVGIIVEESKEVLTFAEESIERVAVIDNRIEYGFIRGISRCGEQLIIILNTENILLEQQNKEIREIMEETALTVNN